MAKNKKTKETNGTETDFDFLASEIGGSVLSKTDSVKNWIDTGNLALNFLCSGRFVGGGIPSGKIIEIFGNSSSCKTLFALNILHGVQTAGGIAVFLDAEGTISKEFAAKAAHVDPTKVIVIPPEKIPTLEKCFKAMQTVIKKSVAAYGTERPICIIYDSIAASPSEREFANIDVEEGMSKEKIKALGGGVQKPGERARICSEQLRTLNPMLDKSNTSIVFINQLRQKIGVLYGNPNTTGGGGKSLEYYCSVRLETRASQRLKDKLDNIIGMKVSVSNQKNKVFRPFVNAKDMHLFFDKGINPFGGLLDLLVKQERIASTGGGNYKVLEPWANGREIKFKSSLERNDVPLEALLACPELLDATSPDQIMSYMDNFGQAVDAVDTDVNISEDIADEITDE